MLSLTIEPDQTPLSLHQYSCPVLQRIWGSPDAIMLIFAGAAAEFATIKAVDWLFFTNALPADPLGRFFETVRFAQHICFSPPAKAAAAVAAINRIHQRVENKRGYMIPDWAYRDVLFMLIDYGERAHTIVYGPMLPSEQQAHFAANIALGQAMHLNDLPMSYEEYRIKRHQQLLQDYAPSPMTRQLTNAYRTALGPWRYWLLRHLQACLIPDELRPITGLHPTRLMQAILRGYRHLPGGGNKLRPLHGLLFPPSLASQLRRLNRLSQEGHMEDIDQSTSDPL